MKVQQIDPMLERTSKTGLAPGGGRYKKKLSYTERKKLGRKLAKQFYGELNLITDPSIFDSSLPIEGNAFVISLPAK